MRYWIGLGSNLGDRLATLRGAVKALDKIGTVTHRSRVFAASPIGGPPQPPFLNAAVVLVTEMEPPALLAACQRLEAQFGRNRSDEEVRWGPRTLDIDLLLAGERGELVMTMPDLEIPHPRLHERGFALASLLDLEGALMHPTQARPLKALLAAANHQGHALAPTGDFL